MKNPKLDRAKQLINSADAEKGYEDIEDIAHFIAEACKGCNDLERYQNLSMRIPVDVVEYHSGCVMKKYVTMQEVRENIRYLERYKYEPDPELSEVYAAYFKYILEATRVSLMKIFSEVEEYFEKLEETTE